MPEQESIDTKIAVLQTNFVHLTETVKELKIGQDKMQSTMEKMNEKLDTAYVTKEEFFKFQTEFFNPVKKKVDNLWWYLAVFIGGGGVIITAVNWYLLYLSTKSH